MSNGSEVEFGQLSYKEFKDKCQLENLEGQIYKQINTSLSDKKVQDQIRKEYPNPEIKRRNTMSANDAEGISTSVSFFL